MLAAQTVAWAGKLSPVVHTRAQISTRRQRSCASAFEFYMPSHETLLKGLSRWIEICNDGDMRGFMPFDVGGTTVGYVSQGTASRLESVKESALKVKTGADGHYMCLDPDPGSMEDRSEAVAATLRVLREDGFISGWRDELYPVVGDRFNDAPALLVERAAAPFLGVKAYGVHMNGYVRKADGLHIWVATRSQTKPTWPGKLDHLAAGGQPHGLGVVENMIKEAGEEAGVPAGLAQQARPVGAVSYIAAAEAGEAVKRDVLFTFDLELPADFKPVANDGEVESFKLRHVNDVMETVAFTDDYKTNCNLVLIEFFFRHGLLDPGAPGYLELLAGLRQSAVCA